MLSEKKILFLDHFNRHGGAQEYALDIAARLGAMGVSVTIPEVSLPTLKDRTGDLPTTGFTVLDKNFKSPLFYIQFIRSAFQLGRYFPRNHTDIIHCNSIPVLILAKFVKRRGQKVVLTCHDCNLSSFRIGIIKKCADAIICVSHTVKRYLQDRGVRQKMRVVYNGFSDPPPLPPRTTDRSQITFGIIGRIERWKGVHTYIDAARKVIENGEGGADFQIIGSAEDQAYHSELTEMASGKDYIRFMPFETDKSKIYSRLDVVVNASVETEPFGRTLVEAGLYRLPAIGPDQGGPSEIIEDGVTGLLFRIGNADSLAQKMETLVKSESLRKTLGKNGARICRGKFSIDTVCGEIIDFYDSIENISAPLS